MGVGICPSPGPPYVRWAASGDLPTHPAQDRPGLGLEFVRAKNLPTSGGEVMGASPPTQPIECGWGLECVRGPFPPIQATEGRGWVWDRSAAIAAGPQVGGVRAPDLAYLKWGGSRGLPTHPAQRLVSPGLE